MKGRRFHDILPLPVADAHLRLVRQTIETRASQTIEYSLHVSAPENAGSRGARVCSASRSTAIRRSRSSRATSPIASAPRSSQSQNVYLQEELKVERSFGEIVGQSSAMQQVFRAIERVADTDSTVLLLGETGTGKELIARAIHRLSRRRDAVMVKVNCGALPSSLAESELFGHERGAFTGAVQQKRGRFELANNGTIFLDEVGELSLDVQVKLLRVLQEQELERLGSTRPTKVNIRVIAATNRDLQAEVQRGSFRSDLFYRLNIFPIHIPPLRDRKEDVPLLAGHFVIDFARADGQAASIASARWPRHGWRPMHWPGNVRELANVMERAVILCEGSVIQDEHIGVLGPRVARRRIGRVSDARGDGAPAHPACAGADGRSARRAAGGRPLLGMSRSTVWSRMRKLGINGPRT